MNVELGDVQLPESIILMSSGTAAMIKIGKTGKPAKVGRIQPALVEDGIAQHALRALVKRREREGCGLSAKLVPGDYVQLRDDWREGAEAAGVKELKTSPHSPRAGKATEAVHVQMSDAEAMKLGRWSSLPAMRVYLDQIGAAAAAQKLPDSARWKLRKACEFAYTFIPDLREGLAEGQKPEILNPSFEFKKGKKRHRN